jgi:hypothetical protein
MACIDCKGDCRQGRDCPHRLTLTDYQMRYYYLKESITKCILKIINRFRINH